jgi:hypothetical protein
MPTKSNECDGLQKNNKTNLSQQITLAFFFLLFAFSQFSVLVQKSIQASQACFVLCAFW